LSAGQRRVVAGKTATGFVTGHDFSHAATGEKDDGALALRKTAEKGNKQHEGPCIGKEDLRQVQGHHSQGSGQGDLRERKAQAAPGLGQSGIRGSFHEQ
jgi:hypothetical protein